MTHEGIDYRPCILPDGTQTEDYFVSECGKVLSTKRKTPKVMSASFVGGRKDSRYLLVSLYLGGRNTRRQVLVHHLVACAWLSLPPTPDAEINHRDADKTNNHVANLEWVTRSQNMKHAADMGLLNMFCDHAGSRNPKAKLTERDVRFIRGCRYKAKTLSRKFGVTRSVIYRIRKGRTWTHVA